MTRTSKLSAKERRLTAIQRAALTKCRTGPKVLRLQFRTETVESLLRRRLIDLLGRWQPYGNRYVITELGRTVLKYREAHTGRAKR